MHTFTSRILLGLLLLLQPSCTTPQIDESKPLEKKQCFYGERVCIHTKESDGSIQQYLQTNLPQETMVSYHAWFTNLKGEFKPFNRCLVGNHRIPLFNLVKPKMEGEQWEYRWKGYARIGCRTKQHNDKTLYELPYKHGEHYTVVQGEHGTSSHQGPDAYSYEFGMPKGTTVTAARSGTVVDMVKEKVGIRVLIEQPDGTIGSYRSLKTDGCFVTLGQKIHAGESLGLLAGNATEGVTTDLCCNVSTPTPSDVYAFKTFPLKFKTSKGVQKLKEREVYKH